MIEKCKRCDGSGYERDPLHEPITVKEMENALSNVIGTVNASAALRIETPDGKVYTKFHVFAGAGVSDELTIMLLEK